MMAKDETYLPSKAVRQRYGGVSEMWIWRRSKDNSGFPKPIVIARRKLWALSELVQWEAEQSAKRGNKAAA